MKLDRYTVTYIISDPDHPGTKVEATTERCNRDKLLAREDLVAKLIRMFEETTGEPS